MYVREVHRFDDWRTAARELLAREVPPDAVLWQSDHGVQGTLGFGSESPQVEPATSAFRVPPDFVTLAKLVACHCSDERWTLLYRALWRITHGERHLLEVAVDDDVHQLRMLEKSVRRDIHKMHAFVRFYRQEVDGEERYLAWYRPDHDILREAAPFFVKRFRVMQWSIFTPDESASWNGDELLYSAGVPLSRAPADDSLVELWRTYYGSIFNPARLKLRAMRREMPERFWDRLPEAAMIDELIAGAPARVREMVERQEREGVLSAAAFLPEGREFTALRDAAARCQGCTLHARATQTVFGEGPPDARLVFVGEQPGDNEDLQGRPFVGPAGQLFDRAMAEVGLRRETVYVTNAVKHFKWEPSGKRRLHSKPQSREINACRPWLEAELEMIRPSLLVCMGATAEQSLLGGNFRITRERGRPFASQWSPWTMATYHPSAVLRASQAEAGERIYADFVADLRLAAEALRALPT